MRHRSKLALLVPLAQTLLISGGGFILVSLLTHDSTTSSGELAIGPVAVALMWLGLRQAEKAPKT